MTLYPMLMRKFLIFSLILTLGLTSAACGGPSLENTAASSPKAQPQSQTQSSDRASAQTRLPDGQYDVQQVTYDDSSGEYNVMLLNTAPGQPSMFRAANLQMARLTNEEISSGKKTYLKVEQGQPALYLTEDFRIEYIHNVTETQTNPQTGQQEVVVVRQEPSFWTPFAGALAGQALGSLLFRPQYYVPPIYQPGVPLSGFGGYGSSYNQAVSRYQTRYNAPPAEVRNRQVFRTTGQLRSPSYGQSGYRRSPTGFGSSRPAPGSTTTRPASPSYGNDRPTGSGYGTSTLRRSNPGSGSSYRSPNSGFGSSRSRSRSFGSSRRR